MTVSQKQISHVRAFDVIRGTACLLVVLGHARALAFVDYRELPVQGWVTNLIYALTGLGEQAVVVFFLLSGYWVGGQAISRLREDRFSISDYFLARISRIYIVLIPAVGLSLLPIFVGLQAATRGETSGTASVVAEPNGSWTAISLWSLFSIQPNLVAPPPGNSALWSLGIEFQTYVLFGFVLLGLKSGKLLIKILALGVCLGVVYLLGAYGLGLALIWLIGVGVKFMPQPSAARKWQVWASVILVFLVAVVDSTHRFDPWSRILLGLAGAWLLYVASGWRRRARKPGYPSRLLEWVGAWSFSLYAAHLPVMLTFVVAVGLERTAAVHKAMANGAILVFCSLVLSFVFYMLTERHTATIRAGIRGSTSFRRLR